MAELRGCRPLMSRSHCLKSAWTQLKNLAGRASEKTQCLALPHPDNFPAFGISSEIFSLIHLAVFLVAFDARRVKRFRGPLLFCTSLTPAKRVLKYQCSECSGVVDFLLQQSDEVCWMREPGSRDKAPGFWILIDIYISNSFLLNH